MKPDPVAASDALDQQLVGISEDINRVFRFNRQNRIVIAFIFMLTVVVGYNTFRIEGTRRRADLAKSAAQQAARTQAVVDKARCEAGNDYRRQDLALWTEVLALSASSANQASLTPQRREQQRQQLEQFRSFLATHDQIVDCSKVVASAQSQTGPGHLPTSGSSGGSKPVSGKQGPPGPQGKQGPSGSSGSSGPPGPPPSATTTTTQPPCRVPNPIDGCLAR